MIWKMAAAANTMESTVTPSTSPCLVREDDVLRTKMRRSRMARKTRKTRRVWDTMKASAENAFSEIRRFNSPGTMVRKSRRDNGEK